MESKLLKMRTMLKGESDNLNKLSKYMNVKTYHAGESFGELALLYG